MALSLEELRRQRANIQQHLDWLDAKIRELDSGEEKSEKTKPAPAAAKVAPAPAKVAEPVSEPAETAEETPEVELDEIIEPTYKVKTANELMRAKIGCLAFFILSTLLFLFLLFGLPYLL